MCAWKKNYGLGHATRSATARVSRSRTQSRRGLMKGTEVQQTTLGELRLRDTAN